ncbi:unnamed protein product [Polarella glacialis]|uniref:Fe2OG dioxygenase domain-containing protein n=1 Tax=Polarella glacialis TaxID=89957 RepID=A0A813CZC6_POLGL|nr:unnamed protein product [Polarella glacialis]
MNRVHLNRFALGDGLGWHHDNSEFFFNLLLQQSPSGGKFEFVPNSEGDMAKVRTALQSVVPDGFVHSEPEELAPGGALLFCGRRSMHRVTPVADDALPRMTAILNFASEPGGGIIEEYTRRKFFGRSLQQG